MRYQFSFYDPKSGLFTGEYYATTDENAVKLNVTDVRPAAAGRHDHLSKKFDLDKKSVVDYQPPAPSADHVWDDKTKRWVLSADAAARAKAKSTAGAAIAQLEASQHRVVRELTLNLAGARAFGPGEHDAATARLKAIDDEIAKLRTALN